MARLDRCCEVTVDGVFIDNIRHWEVTIRKHQDRAAPVRVRRLSLREAITEAIREAGARGWPD